MDINGIVGDSLGNNPASYIDLSNDYLYDGSTGLSVDWNNRILSGNWTAQGLTISGQVVVGGGGGGGSSTTTFTTVTPSGTTVICNFSNSKNFMSLTGNGGGTYTFSGINSPTGNGFASTSLYISNLLTGAGAGSLSFPTGWAWIGLTPVAINSGKNGYLNLESFGGNIVVTWGAQY